MKLEPGELSKIIFSRQRTLDENVADKIFQSWLLKNRASMSPLKLKEIEYVRALRMIGTELQGAADGSEQDAEFLRELNLMIDERQIGISLKFNKFLDYFAFSLDENHRTRRGLDKALS